MEKCYKCESVFKKIKDEPYHYTESGLDYIWLIGILQYRCEKCGETYIEIPHINELHLLIGKTLVCKKELLGGSEVKFLRKEIGMKGKALAEALSMNPETYSRWENGKQALAACHDKTLRMIYVMNASEKYGKILFKDSQSILHYLAVKKASKKGKKIQFTPSEWITRLIDEPIFGSAVCTA